MRKKTPKPFKDVEQKSAYLCGIEEKHAKIANLFKRIRISNNVSIDSIVRKTGLNKKVINDIESFSGNPKLTTLIKYCDAAGIDLIDLLHGRLNFEIVGIDKEEGKICYQNKKYLKQ